MEFEDTILKWQYVVDSKVSVSIIEICQLYTVRKVRFYFSYLLHWFFRNNPHLF